MHGVKHGGAAVVEVDMLKILFEELANVFDGELPIEKHARDALLAICEVPVASGASHESANAASDCSRPQRAE